MIPELRVSRQDRDLAKLAKWDSKSWRVGKRKLVQIIADRVQPDRAKIVGLKCKDQSNLIRSNLVIRPSMQSLVLLSPEDEDLRIRLSRCATSAYIRTGAETGYAHRVIALRMGLDIWGVLVDHRNRNPLDNRRSNLRVATKSQNNTNSKLHSHNVSGFRGVSWCNTKRKWVARINHLGKAHHIGYFIKKNDAREAYSLAAGSLHGEFSHGKKEQT